jgi:hypothetical protein
VIKNTVCKHRELNANPDNDNRNFVCDAVSFGIGFQAKVAQFGSVVAPAPPVYGCGPNWKAQCN